MVFSLFTFYFCFKKKKKLKDLYQIVQMKKFIQKKV